MLEEVVVTAQKREESLQDTPISLSAFGAQDLENKGIQTLDDLQANVPNLQLTPHPNSATTPRVFMRGVGNNDDQITQDPSVAVYLDGVYVARSQGLSMSVADIERIEVLRGPQGTLYGRNATGGAINFITARPEIGEWGFKQEVSLGNRHSQRLKTMLNAPLGDNLAARLSYLNTEKDGFINNQGTDVDHFGDQDRDAWRADLLWQPTDKLELRYSYDRSNIHDSPALIARVDLHPQFTPTPSAAGEFVRDLQPNDITSDGHNLTITYDLNDHLTLKSISAYRALDSFTNQNYHAGLYAPLPLFTSTHTTDQEQWSQEIQLLGDAWDSRLEYIVGLYYFNEEGVDNDDTRKPLSDEVSFGEADIKNTALAAFSQATWTPNVLADRLRITAGLRWSQDKRSATLEERDITLSSGAVTDYPKGVGDNTFTNVSPSLVVAYDLTDNINLYAKVVDGYKTGGFNTRASSIDFFNQGFDPENLRSYELGIKSELLDNRVRLNAAVFTSDYEDLQVNVRSDGGDPTKTDVLNAGEGKVQGLELDVTALLTEGLTLNLSYGYLDADYEEIVDATGSDIADNFRFTNAPKHSYTVDLNYDFPALSFGQLSAHIGYTWQDEKYTSSSVDDEKYIVDDYGLLNARLSLSDVAFAGGNLRLALWGKNLEDQEYYTAHFGLVVPSAVYGEPRSYGLDLIYEY
ncbi:TonB-dependent receptor [Aestuariicella hydrocarbonica]|uniref:TonB-dependent receptor n=2 Tax=Pseudomaricurvus hydrocarbonicus TaxID=1470433 RepID=A0A9E5K093_9GAMM|nr:TonB-dependent receptor [Aestuariicella hydrocarbonica]